jgi:hypothetical protein
LILERSYWAIEEADKTKMKNEQKRMRFFI